MVVIQKGTGTVDLLFTLSEKATLPLPGYRFVFTNITTKAEVEVTFAHGDDTSDYPERYNRFMFDRSAFANVDAGQYQYVAYEVPSGNVLEVGKMLLQPEAGLSTNGYADSPIIKGYGG